MNPDFSIVALQKLMKVIANNAGTKAVRLTRYKHKRNDRGSLRYARTIDHFLLSIACWTPGVGRLIPERY